MPLRFGDNVSTAETDYGTVLLDERAGEYWELNPTATLVVRTLLAGGEESEAAAALVREFDIDQAQALQDVETLVGELRRSGLAS
ncbi:lasso peptide biosynthesis PqqD family chaperone [Streptomyces cyaneochromogenes]|uniref:Lasso peptide biosynthesis PqqD family chaperone n=1 Tax=Streptomyces cyaneochromogenes TaxID=2496836 RepID=A0A3S9MGR9_9ACTN|nr:lasso peptide biosynthesis PqqD family chaperone [Streptomyces cyaneochromogenes]AZQ38395.1 lasso peptide biosynthesis PqqD family chaperone [Streptomyces cyaneochromogenes]